MVAIAPLTPAVPPTKPALASLAPPLTLEKNIFQVTLDKAIEGLNVVSNQEEFSEQLIQDYLKGKASLESVMIEVEKAHLSISFALTVVNTSVQALKEIMQMPI